jgi:hypothetical protein
MKKIIRLTESDLEKIVRRVLKEDMEVEPDMVDIPVDKVRMVQQALVNAGYNIGPTGVDGKFGKNTRAAVIQYQKKNGIKQTGNVGPITGGKLGVQPLTSGKPTQQPVQTQKPTTGKTSKTQSVGKTDVSLNPKFAELNKSLFPKDNANLHSDYLGKGGQFERETHGGMTQEQYLGFMKQLKKVPPAKKSSLPLHIRALMDYLGGRTEPFTAADLTRKEQEFLKNVAIANAKKGLTYPLWKSIGAGNLPTAMTAAGSEKENQNLKTSGQGSLTDPGLAGEFMYTLGEVDPPAIKVSPDKTSVTVRDNYDFNSVGLPKEKIMQNFTDALSGYFTGKGTLYSVVRNAVAFKEGDGYPGYPVNITV